MNALFKAFGHPNILATHKTTLELTEEKNLSVKGDCIIGVKAELPDLTQFLSLKKAWMKIKVQDYEEIISFEPNPSYKKGRELVIRLGQHRSERTFGTDADKAAKHLNRRMIELIKNPEQEIQVEIYEKTA